MTPRRKLLFNVSVAWLLAIGGCGRTLVFGEHDGVNLGIRADSSNPTPVEVNFGLNRAVATVVPPAGDSNGIPRGEAVNMFAGFQVERFKDLAPNKPLDVDLQITTQFASGAAAVAIAGDPPAVARVVTLPGTTARRDANFISTQAARAALVMRINRLSDSQAVAVASAMAPRLSERADPTVTQLAASIPRGRPFLPADARAFLRRWAVLDTVTPAAAAEWENALTNAGQ